MPVDRPFQVFNCGTLKPAKMVQRLTYRRRHAYATKSNRTRVVKTPGARIDGV